jgi:hypothetical protein
MSRQLTTGTVMEKLQEAIFDWADLCAKRTGDPMKGVVFDSVPLLYRGEEKPSYWRVTIEPIVGYTPDGRSLTGSDDQADRLLEMEEDGDDDVDTDVPEVRPGPGGG